MRKRGSRIALFGPKGSMLRWIGTNERAELLQCDAAYPIKGSNAIRLREKPITRYRPPETSISFRDAERNAGVDGPEAVLGEDADAIGRSKGKVEAWPEIFDTRNTIISGGVAHGVIEIDPATIHDFVL